MRNRQRFASVYCRRSNPTAEQRTGGFDGRTVDRRGERTPAALAATVDREEGTGE